VCRTTLETWLLDSGVGYLHLQKVVCFILFIYPLAFDNNVISNGKSYCCNDTFSDVQFTSLLAKNV